MYSSLLCAQMKNLRHLQPHPTCTNFEWDSCIDSVKWPSDLSYHTAQDRFLVSITTWTVILAHPAVTHSRT